MQTIVLENEFLSSEFNAETTSYPFAQVLNEKHKSESGFFVSVENLGAADWQLPSEQQFHSATWRSGEQTQGILIPNPRLLVLAHSPLFMSERATGLNLGAYDSEYYRQHKQEVVLKTKYLVYFVDEQNQLLHNLPMQLTMKGAAGATFGEHLLKFRTELEKAFAVVHKKPLQRKSDRFHALGVFCIETEPQLKGNEQKNWVCTIIKHEQPTLDNWLNYFLGFTPLKERILADVDNNVDFGKLKVAEATQVTTASNHLLLNVEEINSEDGAVATSALFAVDEAPVARDIYTSASTVDAEAEGEQESDIPF
jgi:hypothetical protein